MRGQTPGQGWKPPRKPQNCKELFLVETVSSQYAFQGRLHAKCTWEPTFGACSWGGNVCYEKDAENNHTCVLRNHMHIAENKQNYSFPKYLRVESLQKASNLYWRSKIEFRERKEGDRSQRWGFPVAFRQKDSQLSGAHFFLEAEQEGVRETAENQGKSRLPKACSSGGKSSRQWPPTSFILSSFISVLNKLVLSHSYCEYQFNCIFKS